MGVRGDRPRSRTSTSASRSCVRTRSVARPRAKRLEAHGAREQLSASRIGDRPRLAPRFGADRRRRRSGRRPLVNWRFNAWAKYENYALDAKVGEAVARITGCRAMSRSARTPAIASSSRAARIDTDGAGTLLVTEECLLSTSRYGIPDSHAKATSGSFETRSGSGRRSGLGRAASATTRTATSTTSPASPRPAYRARLRGRSRRRRESSPFGGQPRTSRAGGFDRGEYARRHAALSAPGHDERRAPAGELREFLRRERRRDCPDVQRRERPRRAEHARRAFPGPEVVGIHAVDLVGDSARCTA